MTNQDLSGSKKLIAHLAINGITIAEVAKAINRSPNQTSKKIHGKAPFTVAEVNELNHKLKIPFSIFYE